MTGYLIEKALATENVFVWVTVFTYFAVPPEFQKRVLLYGVIGAIVMRAVLIYLGVMLIEKFDWMFYVFGLFLFVTGVKMMLSTEKIRSVTSMSTSTRNSGVAWRSPAFITKKRSPW